MQDVIFAGAAGVQSRNAAEVEVLLDNSDRGLDSDFSEISIVRKLSREGEGEYRLNGARCRMVDVSRSSPTPASARRCIPSCRRGGWSRSCTRSRATGAS